MAIPKKVAERMRSGLRRYQATPVQFSPGEVWSLQYWFRDEPPAGGHNTSNGLSVTFE